MNYSGIAWESIVDGCGIRNTLFTSGCVHMCKECHNPDTWNFNSGSLFDEQISKKLIENSKNNPLLKGLTLSGGDPFCHAKELAQFVKEYKLVNPEHDIWIYSGYTFESLAKDSEHFNLLKECDVLVDGIFIQELKDLALEFRGSSNQRLIDVKRSLIEYEPVLYK